MPRSIWKQLQQEQRTVVAKLHFLLIIWGSVEAQNVPVRYVTYVWHNQPLGNFVCCCIRRCTNQKMSLGFVQMVQLLVLKIQRLKEHTLILFYVLTSLRLIRSTMLWLPKHCTIWMVNHSYGITIHKCLTIQHIMLHKTNKFSFSLASFGNQLHS
jgi:hypothetical protein